MNGKNLKITVDGVEVSGEWGNTVTVNEASPLSEEQQFRDAIDRSPDDGMAWGMYADWLDERGDPRADGVRAIGRVRWVPFISAAGHGVVAWTRGKKETTRQTWRLPNELTRQLKDAARVFGKFRYYPSRWAAYDALALAWGRLPAERRAGLLEGVG